MKPSALLVGDIVHARKEWEECADLVELETFPTGTRSEFLTHLTSASLSDVLVIYRSNDSASITGPFDAELLHALPQSVKFIVHNGAGYDNIDIPTATARGIQVSHTPNAVSDATADIALFLLLGAIRKLGPHVASVKRGEWRAKVSEGMKLGNDPRGKVLGILGLGGIGKAVAKRAEGFGMKVRYWSKSGSKKGEEGVGQGWESVGFEELVRESDVISVNLAMNKETRHILGEKEFAMMKEGVVLVNTARGGLIDEKALVKALKEGKVGAAGLDVFENEPKIEEELLELDNVFLLPHMGTSTRETQKDMELLVLENMRSAVKEGKLVTQVPEQRK